MNKVSVLPLSQHHYAVHNRVSAPHASQRRLRWISSSDTTVPVNGIDRKISEEEMEEYRMLSNFSASEVKRIFKVFFEATDGAEVMQQSQFLRLEGISANPLKHRVARCFGFEELPSDGDLEWEAGETGKGISFSEFLIALSVFNVAGRRGQKLKMAFIIQDFDDDGVISRTDLLKYFRHTVESDLNHDEMAFLVDEIVNEVSSLPQLTGLTFSDFQRVVGPTDFETRLRLPI